MTDEINRTLKTLDINDTVMVVYYNEIEKSYLTATGQVAKLDAKAQILTIAALDINFADIYTISK